MKVGFIGTGVMGKSMAGHLLDAGHELTVYNRTRARAEDLLGRGATWADTPGGAADGAEAVFTIVGFPDDVETIYFGADGILDAASSGAILVDMTTSRPDLAVRIAKAAEERGMQALDAPVSGGDVGAREARLSIMIGGPEAAFDAVKPLFDLMGANIVLQGPAGSGQHTKMCNQIAIAAGMLGVCESVAYAKASGLDPERVLTSIESGAAGSWSLSNLAPRMIAGNFAPGFYVKHFIKDLGIALESARAMKLRTPGLELAMKLYKELAEKGGENDGTQALYRLYDPDA
ncbi:MAG: NAD(P)-dependent oxidoreductase [Spirochaetota bacterium]